MRSPRRPRLSLLGFILLCVGAVLPAACRSTPSSAPISGPTPELAGIRVILDRAIESDEGLLAAAEAVFLGEVIAISPTRFNQDSGDYYDGAMGVHTVTFRLIQPIVDEIGLGEEVTLTSGGGSPIDDGRVVLQGQSIQSYEITVPHELATGQEVVVFAARGELAWRGGTRETLGFAVWAGDSYFYSDNQGQYRRDNSELSPMTMDELVDYVVEHQ